jgi:hypothetical protein
MRVKNHRKQNITKNYTRNYLRERRRGVAEVGEEEVLYARLEATLGHIAGWAPCL